MSRDADLEVCRGLIRHGSRSFHAASLLLPRRLRDQALALYAFCRLADDAVDLRADKAAAVARLEQRLDCAYAGRPRDHAVDRAFATMLAETGMPRLLPGALIEGLAWDAAGRRYATLAELRAYAARVAAAVGAMMCVLMEARQADTLARACDLGIAMQLTNIARDIGEDARAGRLFLPLDWLEEAGIAPAAFLAAPCPSPALAALTGRLLSEAERLYLRAAPGIVTLPRRCRPGIAAALQIYSGIGRRIAAAGYDSVSCRAQTTTADKLRLAGRAVVGTLVDAVMPRSPLLHARPLAETAFLVRAATLPAHEEGAAHSGVDTLLDVLGTLRARDQAAAGRI